MGHPLLVSVYHLHGSRHCEATDSGIFDLVVDRMVAVCGRIFNHTSALVELFERVMCRGDQLPPVFSGVRVGQLARLHERPLGVNCRISSVTCLVVRQVSNTKCTCCARITAVVVLWSVAIGLKVSRVLANLLAGKTLLALQLLPHASVVIICKLGLQICRQCSVLALRVRLRILIGMRLPG